jgi:hypothetical protein
METATQVEKPNGAPAKSGFQRRVDRLTREKYELQADLQRALNLLAKYREALRLARRVNG